MRFRIGNGEHEEANNEEWRRLVAGVHPVRDVLLLLSGHSGLLHLRVDHAASAVDAFSLIWWEKGSLPEFGCTDSWIDWIWTRRGHNWHLGQGEFWNSVICIWGLLRRGSRCCRRGMYAKNHLIRRRLWRLLLGNEKHRLNSGYDVLISRNMAYHTLSAFWTPMVNESNPLLIRP